MKYEVGYHIRTPNSLVCEAASQTMVVEAASKLEAAGRCLEAEPKAHLEYVTPLSYQGPD